MWERMSPNINYLTEGVKRENREKMRALMTVSPFVT